MINYLIVAALILLQDTSQDVSVEPRGFAEPCLSMGRAERLEYQFDSTAELDFNIHYHAGENVFFPVDLKALTAQTGVFVAPAARTYCLMWTNKGDHPVQLQYRYRHLAEEGAP